MKMVEDRSKAGARVGARPVDQRPVLQGNIPPTNFPSA
jgi:hypothetical protein